MIPHASFTVLRVALVGAIATLGLACSSTVDGATTTAATTSGAGGATSSTSGSGGAQQNTGGAAQNTGGAAQGGAGGASQGGAGGGVPTCTVTYTVIALPEGSPCGVPSGDPCDPGSMCDIGLGLYCAGTDCAGTIEGVCTKWAEDCAAAGGPAVRGCNGKCYDNGCYAAHAYTNFDIDDTCAGAGGAGGAGGGG
jgi:hypothetical protein